MRRLMIVCMLSACVVDDSDPDAGSEEDSSEGDSSSSAESLDSEGEGTTLPVCSGDVPMFESCTYDCDCAEGSCRFNYPGGYLAECTTECDADADCPQGTCSGGWCVQLCAADRSCGEGTWCYPGVLLDGTPLADPQHPDPHCMPKACEILGCGA